MADDLKQAIAKLLATRGEKKQFFAYASGVRNDGKGDGELVIRGTRPKKAEVEGELKAGKDFLEGSCWVGKKAGEEEVVFFQGNGKKISEMTVTRMMHTARKVTGRQYDFRVPSEEEEARVAKLAEGDPAAAGDDAERARFEAELAALRPGVEEYLNQHRGDSDKMRAVLDFAQGKAEAGQLPAAFLALRELSSLEEQARMRGMTPHELHQRRVRREPEAQEAS